MDVQNMWYLYGPAVFLQLFVFCALACCKNVARKSPINYVCLGIFTICWTFILTWITTFYTPEEVTLAALFTAAITLTISVYACFTENDFTVLCGPFLCMGLLMVLCVQMMLSLLTSLLWYSSGFYFPFCAGFCVILYALYILVDTQLIVGGGRHELSIDDYIIGAIILYIDIIMLFLKLL